MLLSILGTRGYSHSAPPLVWKERSPAGTFMLTCGTTRSVSSTWGGVNNANDRSEWDGRVTVTLGAQYGFYPRLSKLF
jgi:hypothetical protein